MGSGKWVPFWWEHQAILEDLEGSRMKDEGRLPEEGDA
jgi:hypothetical protein